MNFHLRLQHEYCLVFELLVEQHVDCEKGKESRRERREQDCNDLNKIRSMIDSRTGLHSSYVRPRQPNWLEMFVLLQTVKEKERRGWKRKNDEHDFDDFCVLFLSNVPTISKNRSIEWWFTFKGKTSKTDWWDLEKRLKFIQASQHNLPLIPVRTTFYAFLSLGRARAWVHACFGPSEIQRARAPLVCMVGMARCTAFAFVVKPRGKSIYEINRIKLYNHFFFFCTFNFTFLWMHGRSEERKPLPK